MRFIHAADLHLGSPFLGLTEVPEIIKKPVFQSTFTAFERIVDQAIKGRVDFVLLVGDNFDTPKHSASASDFFIRQLERLDQANVPVVLSFGNHDFRGDFDSLRLPDNVHVLGSDVSDVQLKTLEGESVDISGFSYSQRWLGDDPVANYPDRGGADWYVGTLHGALATGTNDHYAPFKLNELISKHYDYWALGHIHAPQMLINHPAILYSGTPQGRNVNEGGPHGYQLVETENGELVPHYHVCSPVEWNTVTINADANSSVTDLTIAIAEQIGQLKTPDYTHDQSDLNPNDVRNRQYVVDSQPDLRMVTVNVIGHDLSASVEQQIKGGALLSRLEETAQSADQIKWWPRKIHLINAGLPDSSRQLDAPSWQAAAGSVFNSETVLKVADKLANNSELADRLTDPATIADLRQRAEELLRGGDSDED